MPEKEAEMLKDRGSAYGDFYGHASVAQRIKNVIKSSLDTNEQFILLAPAEKMVVRESLDMIAHKIGRIANGNPRVADSWDDIGGYAKIARIRVCKDETK